MRFLVIVSYFDALGGLEIYGRQVVEALSRLGQEVEVWSILESKPGSPEEEYRIC